MLLQGRLTKKLREENKGRIQTWVYFLSQPTLVFVHQSLNRKSVNLVLLCNQNSRLQLALKLSQNKIGHATGRKEVTQISLFLRLVLWHQKDCVNFLGGGMNKFSKTQLVSLKNEPITLRASVYFHMWLPIKSPILTNQFNFLNDMSLIKCFIYKHTMICYISFYISFLDKQVELNIQFVNFRIIFHLYFIK